MPIKKLKLNNKIIFGFILIFILIVIILFQTFNRPTSNIIENRQRLILSNFTTKRYSSHFTFANESLNIDKAGHNKVRKALGLSKYYENIKTAALKLGLSNESRNPTTGITLWTRQGESGNAGNNIYLDERTGYFKVIYDFGINSSPLESKDYMTYINSFFGLYEHETSILSESKLGKANVYTYSVKFMGSQVYFSDADPNYANIISVDGKIVNLLIYILPGEFLDYLELNPVEKVSRDNILSLNYQVNFEYDAMSNSSVLGSEIVFSPPANIGFRGQKEGYSLFYDTNQGWLLIPIVIIEGVFTDASSQRGKSYLLVVNQAP